MSSYVDFIEHLNYSGSFLKKSSYITPAHDYYQIVYFLIPTGGIPVLILFFEPNKKASRNYPTGFYYASKL